MLEAELTKPAAAAGAPQLSVASFVPTLSPRSLLLFLLVPFLLLLQNLHSLSYLCLFCSTVRRISFHLRHGIPVLFTLWDSQSWGCCVTFLIGSWFRIPMHRTGLRTAIGVQICARLPASDNL